MKLRTVKSIWGGSHVHHHGHSAHRLSLRLDAWWHICRTDAIDQDAQAHIESCNSIHYPAAIVRVFEDAIRLCPSVSMDPEIMEGRPCIDGTRIPVRSVLRVIEHYGSVEEAVKRYPHLSTEQVKDALYFSQVVLEPPSGIDETSVAP
jgi:uncharacterized protein (DUF433 family)